MILTPAKLVFRTGLAGLLLLVVMAGCLLIGSQDISLQKVLQGPSIEGVPNSDYEILVGVRLPRIILAAIVGAALACSGVVFQAILRNPLADPYILGVSSGAGLGSIVAVLLGWTWTFWGLSALMVASFIGAMGTVWLVWSIGRVTGRVHVTGLLLAGVVVNALFSAVIMFLASIAGAKKFQTTMLWLMGSFAELDKMAPLLASGVVVVLGILFILMLGNHLNILSFGREDARSLGVSIERTCFLAFGCAALITSVAVSFSGLIGFVGLIVPHAVRLVAGPDHRQLIPLSALVGAAFLVIADAVARIVVAPAMLPVGVVTAMTGGPFFLILLIRYTKTIHWGQS
ncbi:MAG: iron ABC transporter permease [Phycisphaerae bacterium]|nr:iron ABC transporter permease [Phycisphaerae bacterium]